MPFEIVKRFADNRSQMPGIFPSPSGPMMFNPETGLEMLMLRWSAVGQGKGAIEVPGRRRAHNCHARADKEENNIVA